MRTKTTLVLLFMLISTVIMGCQSHDKASNADRNTATDITKVSIATAKGFSDVNTDFFATYEDEESLKVFIGAISSAVRVEGIVDVSAPEFYIEVTYKDDSKQGYHLWLGEFGQKSSLMKVENTHTIYTMPAALTDKLINVIK